MRSTIEPIATRSIPISNRDAPFSGSYAPRTVDAGLSQRYGRDNMVRDCVRNTGTETDRSGTTRTCDALKRDCGRNGQPVRARRRLRAAQRAHLLRRQRHLLDRLVDAAGRHRLAGLGTHALGSLGQRHRVLQSGAVRGDLADRRRGGRSDRPGMADGDLAIRRRGSGSDPGRADPDRADPGRVHRRALGVQRHGRDVRPAGAPMPAPGPGAPRLSARRGGAELADLQRRPLHRSGIVGTDDRRLGRGAADRLQLRARSCSPA